MPTTPSSPDVTRVPRKRQATGTSSRGPVAKGMREARRASRKIGAAAREKATQAKDAIEKGAKRAQGVTRRATKRRSKSPPRVGEGRPARGAVKKTR